MERLFYLGALTGYSLYLYGEKQKRMPLLSLTQKQPILIKKVVYKIVFNSTFLYAIVFSE
jgi:hypothetical protein